MGSTGPAPRCTKTTRTSDPRCNSNAPARIETSSPFADWVQAALNYAAIVLLTRIWAVILAALATGCLAGMFLLALGSGSDFSESDRAAIRAVTEAGIAALRAEIQASPAQQASALLDDPRLLEAMARSPEREANLPPSELSLEQLLAERLEQLRLRTDSDRLTAGLIREDRSIEASNGAREARLTELVGTDAFLKAPEADPTLSTVALGGELYVAWISGRDERNRRLVAFEPLDIGAGSLLRRVLGSRNPAGIIRDGELLGGIIGDLSIDEEVRTLAADHAEDVPTDGASTVFRVGEGLDARIGALGRVPGPAGEGKDGAVLAVLSRTTAAASQKDLAEALGQAYDKGLAKRLQWVLLGGLFLISAAVGVYLPQVEGIGPLRRLQREFEGLTQGTQHQIFHDRYSGHFADLARAAAMAQEAQRQAFLAELEIDDEDSESSVVTPRPRPRTIRSRRLTRGHRRPDEARTPVEGDGGLGDMPSRDGSPLPQRLPQPTPSREPEPSVGSEDAASTPDPASEPTPPPGPIAPPAGSAGPKRVEARARPIAAPPPTAPKPETRPSSPSVDSGLLSAPSNDDEDGTDPTQAHYKEVYEEFLQTKEACGESTTGLTFERFAAKLEKNTRDLLAKRPDATDVRFTVYIKDGKAALKARVVKG